MKSLSVQLILATGRYESLSDMQLNIHCGDEFCIDRVSYLQIYIQEGSHVAIPVPACHLDLPTAPLCVRYLNFPCSNHEPKIMPQWQSTTIPYRTAYRCA